MPTKWHRYETRRAYFEHVGGPHTSVRKRSYSRIVNRLQKQFGLSKDEALQRATALKHLVWLRQTIAERPGTEYVGKGLVCRLNTWLQLSPSYYKAVIFGEALKSCPSAKDCVQKSDLYVQADSSLIVEPCSTLPPKILDWVPFSYCVVACVKVGSGWLLAAPFSLREKETYRNILRKDFDWLAANLEESANCYRKCYATIHFRSEISRYGTFEGWVLHHALSSKIGTVSRFFRLNDFNSAGETVTKKSSGRLIRLGGA